MTIQINTRSDEFEPERLLGGRYRVIAVLGRGGMGVVYKVEQIYLGIELALKTINKASLTDVSVRRFQAEARAVFALNHPNVISVHDFGLLDDDTPFLAMEFVQGITLSELLKQRLLTVDEAIPVFIQVCAGLAHAHEHGVVHRDIKPGNIMLLDQVMPGTEGSVKILDFGIAKLTESDEGDIQSLTRTGEIFGSPLYMSPEQCSGGKLDHRSDIYSLGCVIFEALTGTTPFVGESALATMMMHQSSTVPSLKEASLGTDFPKELEQIVQSMLAKNPDNRYQNLNEAANDLAATERGEVLPFNPAAQIKSSSKISKAKTKIISMRRGLLIALVLGNLFFSATLGSTSMSVLLATRKVIVTKQEPYVAPIPHSDSVGNFVDAIKKGRCSFFEKYDATDESLKAFQNYDGAQAVKLDACQVTDKGLEALKKSKLLSLIVNDCNITEVHNIASFDYLQTLDLRGTYIKDSDLAALANLKMLSNLCLRNCRITDEGLKLLIPSTSLRSVQVSQGQFSQKAIDELGEKMPQCYFEGYANQNKLQQIVASKSKLGNYAAGESALAVAERANPNLTIVADYWSALSIIRTLEKNYPAAAVLQANARKVLERNGNKARLSEILMQSADLASRQQHWAECDRFADESAKLSIDTMMHNSPELMDRLESLTSFGQEAKLFSKPIENCKRAVEIIKRQAPSKVDIYLPNFIERIGVYSMLDNNRAQALPYFKEHVELRRASRSKDPAGYARALIEVGECETDKKLKRQLYQEGLDLLDILNHPSERNLLEHYGNACNDMIAVCDVERNWTESIKYARRGLAVSNLIKKDVERRKYLFQIQLIRHLAIAGREAEAKQQAATFHIPWSDAFKQ
ncbi:MAG: protein kinase [Cyanobacteria bacterium SZAS-4]|nr:protein kinase [Cyanobacteria bacterium SZAS-4]